MLKYMIQKINLNGSQLKNEINDFIDADNTLLVDNTNISISSRLNISQLPAFIEQLKTTISGLNLSEIIIIGNCFNQIKFSESSIDMFRMLQAVEREPSNETSLTTTATKSPGMNSYIHDADKQTAELCGNYNPLQRENPRKYLLYKPSFSQSLTYISAAFKDLPPHSVLLVYLSADADCTITSSKRISN